MSRIYKALLAPLTIVALICAPVPTVEAQNTTQCNTANLSAFASETITVSTSAVGLTAATYNPGNGQNPASAALVAVNTNNLRAWFDGSAPTTSAGIIVAAGQSFVVCGIPGLQKLKMIRDDASDVEVAVQYFAVAQ